MLDLVDWDASGPFTIDAWRASVQVGSTSARERHWLVGSNTMVSRVAH
jgi:hypothetical protein